MLLKQLLCLLLQQCQIYLVRVAFHFRNKHLFLVVVYRNDVYFVLVPFFPVATYGRECSGGFQSFYEVLFQKSATVCHKVSLDNGFDVGIVLYLDGRAVLVDKPEPKMEKIVDDLIFVNPPWSQDKMSDEAKLTMGFL